MKSISKKTIRVGILTSSSGGLLKAVIEARQAKKLFVDIVKVLSDRNCPALEIAKNYGLDAVVIEHKTRIERDREFLSILQYLDIDYIFLCGYFKILSAEFIQAFPDRIINSHPSLLPEFPGIDTDVYRQVLEAQKEYTGVTVHLVDEQVDHGRILGQFKVKVEKDDTIETLRNRVKAVENNFFPAVCEVFVQQKIANHKPPTEKQICVE